ncbi:unnamed protein product [Durusdinium trenchii]|uniref:Uncharacterized protein n=1 Tax=Durusdinium trenchii TaxID=1381693 RepID=A0ABP0R4F5_9DINO
MISANQEKRSLRDDLEAKIQEQTRRANDFEARYMQLQAQEDIRSPSQQQADRTFVDRLMKDKESLEKGTQKLQEQLAKANLAANELEAKFNQERLQLEAANIDRQELLQRQKLTAEEAAQADKVLQQQIRSAQEAEVKLSNRAAALKVGDFGDAISGRCETVWAKKPTGGAWQRKGKTHFWLIACFAYDILIPTAQAREMTFGIFPFFQTEASA